jgi:hypothetical protein
MKFTGILLLVISLAEMIAAGVYYGDSAYGQQLEFAAQELETAQAQRLAGHALPDEMLAQLDERFERAASEAIEHETIAKTLLYAGLLTALSGFVALVIDGRRRPAAAQEPSPALPEAHGST